MRKSARYVTLAYDWTKFHQKLKKGTLKRGPRRENGSKQAGRKPPQFFWPRAFCPSCPLQVKSQVRDGSTLTGISVRVIAHSQDSKGSRQMHAQLFFLAYPLTVLRSVLIHNTSIERIRLLVSQSCIVFYLPPL